MPKKDNIQECEGSWFFGWNNVKWLCRELLAMYSNKESYFSKKRFESSIAFLSGVGLILAHAYHRRDTITNSEILADAALLFAVAGYTLNHIQKEKTTAPKKAEEPDATIPPTKDIKPTLEEEEGI